MESMDKKQKRKTTQLAEYNPLAAEYFRDGQ
jgi:hypothetical protein